MPLNKTPYFGSPCRGVVFGCCKIGSTVCSTDDNNSDSNTDTDTEAAGSSDTDGNVGNSAANGSAGTRGRNRPGMVMDFP